MLMAKKKFLKNTKAFFARMLPHLKNKYIITIIVFFAWMLCFDRNDIITRVKLKNQLSKLREEKEFYKEEIKKVEETHAQLFSNEETLEKFAREKYLMKKDDEEVFLIVGREE